MAINYQWLVEDSVARFSELMRNHRRLTAEIAKVEKGIVKHEKTLRWAAARLRRTNQLSSSTTAQASINNEPPANFREAVRAVLISYPIPLTPVRVRDLLGMVGFETGRYRNALADVHATLKRLVVLGEVIQDNTLAYQTTYLWNGAVAEGDESRERNHLNSLLRRFSEVLDIIVVKKFLKREETIYQYDPFPPGVPELPNAKEMQIRKERIEEVDTIVCPAREHGFKEAFLDKSAWWAIRLSPSLIPQLKWIAMYESKPVQAIRWIGKIQGDGIKPYKNTGKYIIAVEEKSEIDPIKLDPSNKSTAPQSPRYTTYEKLKTAKQISDLW